MTSRTALTPISAALTVTALGAATILGAWGFELIAGLEPCPLCLEQRLPYYTGVPVAALALIAAWRGARLAAGVLLGIVALIMLWGAGLGVYHSGIEWAWWPGPATCAGAEGAFSTDVSSLVESLDQGTVPSCTEAAWRFLGLSLAGYNALISAMLAAVAGLGAAAALRPTTQ